MAKSSNFVAKIYISATKKLPKFSFDKTSLNSQNKNANAFYRFVGSDKLIFIRRHERGVMI